MALYTLADLHLATDVAKPMDIFGGRWEGHTDKIIRHWRELIAPEFLGLMASEDVQSGAFAKFEQTATLSVPGGAKANIKSAPAVT